MSQKPYKTHKVIKLGKTLIHLLNANLCYNICVRIFKLSLSLDEILAEAMVALMKGICDLFVSHLDESKTNRSK